MPIARRKFSAAGVALGAAAMGSGLLGGCAVPLPKASPVASGVRRACFDSLTVTTLSDGYGTQALDANFARSPGWTVAFDINAEGARLTRRRLADRVIREKILLAGFHLPGAAVGTLIKRGSGYDFLPISGWPELRQDIRDAQATIDCRSGSRRREPHPP